jgi:hypothetical protein
LLGYDSSVRWCLLLALSVTPSCARRDPALEYAQCGTFRFLPCGAGEPPAEPMVITAGAEAAVPPPPGDPAGTVAPAAGTTPQ